MAMGARAEQGGIDAISLLLQDHQTVEKLFTRYEGLRGGNAVRAKRDVADEITKELSVHAAIEEQVFYPGVRDAIGEDLVEEAIEEHQEVKKILAELDGLDPKEARFDSLLTSLVQDVRHHVEEEEGEMFPRFRAAISQDRLLGMGESMQKLKVVAPTRPHPHAPNTPPGNLVAGPVAAVVDRARDVVRNTTRKGQAKRTAAKSGGTGRRTTRPASRRGKVYHVTSDQGVWKVQAAGSSRASSRHDTKGEAVSAGRAVAQRARGQLVIHKRDGKIETEYTYGNDPRRTKG